ncbi:MAG: hypothetical protein ACT4NU_08350 [Chromatiales bacterium]
MTYEIRALPFKPARLSGLSERLVVSHHENNYDPEFTAIGKALAGGSGWVLLAWSPRDSGHVRALLLHRLWRESRRYVNAFMTNIAWRVVEAHWRQVTPRESAS